MDDVKGLCERLRERANQGGYIPDITVMFEAATALQSLAKELAEARAERERLVETLAAEKPFVFDPATHFLHADDGGAPAHGVRYEPASAFNDARIKALEEALAWYGKQARLARLIHREGDAGRHALAADGGKRARVLTKEPT